MERYTWTAEQDEVIRGMILEGKTVADICDRMGCTDTQLKNHVAVVRRRDPSFPSLCGEAKGERFALASAEDAAALSGEPGQIIVEPADEGTVELIEEGIEPEEKKASLNPLEQEMADIIAENNATIEGLREDLETEKLARGEEARVYQGEIKRLKDQIEALKGTVSAQGDELRARDETLKKVYGDLDQAREERDEAQGLLRVQKEANGIPWATPEEEIALANGIIEVQRKEIASSRAEEVNLRSQLRERNELILAMAKAIFLEPRKVMPEGGSGVGASHEEERKAR